MSMENESQEPVVPEADGREHAREEKAEKANDEINRQLTIGLALNVTLAAILFVWGAVALVLALFIQPDRVLWLLSREGVSFAAYLGATSAVLIRWLHGKLDLLPDFDVYRDATGYADEGATLRAKHMKWLEKTGAIPLLVISAILEGLSLFLLS